MKKWFALLALPGSMTANFCCLDGVYAYADALYLKPSTCDFNYVVEDSTYFQRVRNNPVTKNPVLGPVGQELGGCPRYSWGFRVGVGSLFNCDNSDFRIDYTHLKTNFSECVQGCKNTVLWPSYGQTFPPLTSLAGVPAAATSSFDSRYDAGNIEVASIKRKECSFNMRTSVGLHLARFKVTRNVNYSALILVSNTVAVLATPIQNISTQFYSQNKTWGVGPRVAGAIDYTLGWGFGVDAQAGFAVLAGKNKTDNQAKAYAANKLDQTVLLSLQQNVTKPYCCQVFPEFDAAFGLNYDTGKICRCVTAKFSVGYEFRTYLNVVKSSSYFLQPATESYPSGSAYNAVACDPYSLQGLYIRGSFSF